MGSLSNGGWEPIEGWTPESQGEGMRRHGRWAAGTLTAVVAVALLAGCGSSTAGTTTTTTGAGTTTTVPTGTGQPIALGAPVSVPERVVTIPTPAVPGTPAQYNQVQVRQFGSSAATHVLVLTPGTYGGAGDFDLVAPYLVQHVPDLQVWSVMRREGTLQDESLIESTLAGQTTLTQAFDYYLGWIADPSITVHYQPLSNADYAFADQWGLGVALDDLHAVVVAAHTGGVRTVTLGGHSLGGSVAAAYAAWDFDGAPGYTTINGIICIDGCAGSPSAFGSPVTVASAQKAIAALSTKGPWSDALHLGLPWATGAFAQVGALAALLDPQGSATLIQDFKLLPKALDPAGTVTYQALFGHAFDYRTSPPYLALDQVHSGVVASTGDPRPWTPDGITPVQNVANVFAQPQLGFLDWYYPSRLSIDAGAAASLRQTAVANALGLRLLHTAQVNVPLYAFQTSLGGRKNAVARSAHAYQAESKIPSVTVVSRTSTYSHLDPLLASPDQNDFLKTVVPWLDRLDG